MPAAAPTDVSGAAFQWSAPLEACYVNSKLLRITDSAIRVAAGAALGLLVSTAAFVAYCLIMMTFHLAIGGTL